MKAPKLVITCILLLSINAQAQNSITHDDLKTVLGEWTGSLTYLDYSTNEPVTMPANLKVEQGNDTLQLNLFSSYPNEPKANSKGRIKIAKNGIGLDNMPVKSLQRTSDGCLVIITRTNGRDKNKKALMRKVYILGANQFIIRQDVKTEGTNVWLNRSIFTYKRTTNLSSF